MCVFILVSDPGSFWWKAGPFWLPGPVGSSQCHPQANTGEAPGRGRAQRRRIRLGHQLIWNRPRQPGQLPPLTPRTVQESEVRPRTKVKGNIFCFIWEGERNHRECNIYRTVKNDSSDSCFCSTNVAERWNVILSQHLKISSSSQMLGNLARSSTFMLLGLPTSCRLRPDLILNLRLTAQTLDGGGKIRKSEIQTKVVTFKETLAQMRGDRRCSKQHHLPNIKRREVYLWTLVEKVSIWWCFVSHVPCLLWWE